MNVIKQYFLRIRTNSQLKHNNASRITVPYKDSRQIGIIFTVEDKIKHETVKDLIRKLESDGKQVQVIEFLPERKENYEFKFDFFTEDDVSFFGNITSPQANKFVGAPFDFIICLDTMPNPLLLHVLASCKAKCRVGPSWQDGHPYFELMIEPNPNVKVMAETMYQYTTQLK